MEKKACPRVAPWDRPMLLFGNFEQMATKHWRSAAVTLCSIRSPSCSLESVRDKSLHPGPQRSSGYLDSAKGDPRGGGTAFGRSSGCRCR